MKHEVFDMQSQKFVEVNGFEDYNRLIGAECGTQIVVYRVGNTIFAYWVDEEALCHGDSQMNLAVSDHVGYPVFGKAVVTAYDLETGDDVCLSKYRDIVFDVFAD